MKTDHLLNFRIQFHYDCFVCMCIALSSFHFVLYYIEIENKTD